jgi:hypothetical protein
MITLSVEQSDRFLPPMAEGDTVEVTRIADDSIFLVSLDDDIFYCRIIQTPIGVWIAREGNDMRFIKNSDLHTLKVHGIVSRIIKGKPERQSEPLFSNTDKCDNDCKVLTMGQRILHRWISENIFYSYRLRHVNGDTVCVEQSNGKEITLTIGYNNTVIDADTGEVLGTCW